jgi:hypothetical protein
MRTLGRLNDVGLIVERIVGDLLEGVLDEVGVIAMCNVEHGIVARVRGCDDRLLHVGFDMYGGGSATATVHHQHHRDNRDAEGHQATRQQQNQRNHAHRAFCFLFQSKR